MQKCEFRVNCKNNPIITKNYTETYCNGHFQACTRFKVRTSLGDEFVPKNLSPDDITRARKIINHGFKHFEDRIDTYY